MDGGGLGHDDDPGRELVEPADERRPLRGRPSPRMPEQRVHHRAFGVPVAGMDDEAGRFVEREEVLVFVQHVEPDVFGRHDPARRGIGKRDGHDVAERRACSRSADRRAVDGDLPVRDPCLHARAGRGAHIGQVAAEHEIEAQPGVAAVRREHAGRRGHRRSGELGRTVPSLRHHDPDESRTEVRTTTCDRSRFSCARSVIRIANRLANSPIHQLL